MINKRGFMLGEYTLKTIIAVLCLLLLFYLLFTLYSDNKKNKELAQAKTLLDELGQTMNVAKTSGRIQDFTFLGLDGWALISYSKGEKRPLICENNCICLCPAAHGGYNIVGIDIKGMTEEDIQIEFCDNGGICKNFDERINKFYFNPNHPHGAIGDLKVEYKNLQFEITRVVK